MNIAVLLAKQGKKVFSLDGKLFNATLMNYFEPTNCWINNYLFNGEPLNECIIKVNSETYKFKAIIILLKLTFKKDARGIVFFYASL